MDSRILEDSEGNVVADFTQWRESQPEKVVLAVNSHDALVEALEEIASEEPNLDHNGNTNDLLACSMVRIAKKTLALARNTEGEH